MYRPHLQNLADLRWLIPQHTTPDHRFTADGRVLFRMENWNCQPTSGSSDHFVEFVAVVSFGNVFEFASEQIAVLLEERNVPVTRIRHDH